MSGALPNCLRLVGIRFIGSREASKVIGSKQVRLRYTQSRHLQTTCVRYDIKTTPEAAPKEGVKEKEVSTESSAKHQVSVFEEMMKDDRKSALTTTEKVVEHTKTGFYSLVIVAGLGISAVLIWGLVSELWSDTSPTTVFKMTMKQIKAHEKANEILGKNIRGFGDTMSRSHKNLEHQAYIVEGIEYLRVQYHIEGSKRKGKVIVDIKNSKKGKQYRYIIIQLEGYPAGKISILDDRHVTDMEDLPDVDYSEIEKELGITK